MVHCDHRGKGGGNPRVLVAAYCTVDPADDDATEKVNVVFPQPSQSGNAQQTSLD
jgi:ABC-type sulfate transport system substrate-binding protein